MNGRSCRATLARSCASSRKTPTMSLGSKESEVGVKAVIKTNALLHAVFSFLAFHCYGDGGCVHTQKASRLPNATVPTWIPRHGGCVITSSGRSSCRNRTTFVPPESEDMVARRGRSLRNNVVRSHVSVPFREAKLSLPFAFCAEGNKQRRWSGQASK